MRLSIVGVWLQSIQDDEGRWLNGGLYRVDVFDHQLAMKVESHLDITPGIIKSKALSNVGFDGDTWRFTSDWEDGRSGTFVLRRQQDDLFQGHVYVDGRQWSPNLWRRVALAPATAAVA